MLAEAARFRRARLELQEAEIERLRSTLPLEQWQLPLLPVAGMAAERSRRAGSDAAVRRVTKTTRWRRCSTAPT